MQDLYKREINYMRISITEQCNLRCSYCMPDNGTEIPHEILMSYEDIYSVVLVASRLGINKIRITGGEPLVRPNVPYLVKMISTIPSIKIIALTTNAILLPPLAKKLKSAGLSSVNVSLDTLDKDKYKKITRGGNIELAIEGIEAALAVGLAVKINVVMLDSTSKDDLAEINSYARTVGASVQTIKFYKLSEAKEDQAEYDRPLKCEQCNRIRLLSNGNLLTCLHSDKMIKLNLNDIEGSLREAIEGKPLHGVTSVARSVSSIGG